MNPLFAILADIKVILESCSPPTIGLNTLVLSKEALPFCALKNIKELFSLLLVVTVTVGKGLVVLMESSLPPVLFTI